MFVSSRRFLGSGFGGKLFPWPHTAMPQLPHDD